MSSSTETVEIVRVSQKGQATIPKAIREHLQVETPGEVFVYREGERIVMEPVPSVAELRGIHDGGESGEIIQRVRSIRAAERERERTEASDIEPEK